MKNLLSTTALIAGIAFGGAALAQEIVYEWTTGADTTLETFYGTLDQFNAATGATLVGPINTEDTAPYTSTSLLDNVLADAAALSASISNISQNLNDIDASIAVSTTRDFQDMAGVIDALLGDSVGAAFGSYSRVSTGTYAQDIPANLLEVLDPLTLTLGDLATTAIGTLQSGNMTGSFDSSGILSRVTESADGSTTGVSVLAEQYGSIADTIAMQNVSVNSGAIDGSVALVLADVNTMAGAISTTAIGALQSGSMGADITGTMGTVDATTVGIVNALVGTTTH